ncbi:MAG TPA: hypothetical protein VHS96_09355, partial [Bacteroidia bacterium]|nr:hypothetical protein [Bacteroidia bacterium]
GLAHLQDILTYFGVEVFPQKVTVGKIREKLAPEGSFRDETADEALRNMLNAYLNAVEMR